MAKHKLTRNKPSSAPKVRELFEETPICTYMILCGELAKRNLLLRKSKFTGLKPHLRPVVLEPSRAIRILRTISYNTQPNAKGSDLLTLQAYGLLDTNPIRVKLTAIGKLLLHNTDYMPHERPIAGSDKSEERNRF